MKILSQDIFKPDDKSEIKYYTTYQYKEFSDEQECFRLSKDGDKVFAKSVKEKLNKNNPTQEVSQIKYYIRGNNGKQLFDPFPKYSISDNKSSFIDKTCKSNQRFLEVSKSVFDKYVSFLNTESNQYLISAQREIM